MQMDRLDWLSKNWNEVKPDMDITPWQIWGRTTRIHQIFLSRLSGVLKAHELNFKELQTLAAIVLVGPPYQVNPNEITKFNLLTSGGTANLLSRMEKEGLVTRLPDPNDKRSVLIQITEKGLDAFNTSIVEENKIEHKMLSGLNSEERVILSTLLRKLLLSIDPVHLPDEEDRTNSGNN